MPCGELVQPLANSQETSADACLQAPSQPADCISSFPLRGQILSSSVVGRRTCLGACDNLFKPLELDEIRLLLEKTFNLSRIVRVQPVLAQPNTEEQADGEAIVGRCQAMKAVYKSIGRVLALQVNRPNR